MTLLIFFVLLSICVSFLCSLLEAVILSMTPSYLEFLKTKNRTLYDKTYYLYKNLEMPLTSILTFNTIAHTIGAAGAGAQAQKHFGNEVLTVFSVILTLAILIFSEIIPKSIGASLWKRLLPFSVRTLGPMITLSYPIVYPCLKISHLFKKKGSNVSRDEISAMARLGHQEGALEESESKIIEEIIRFRQLKATEIMTPKDRVEVLTIDMSIEEAYLQIQKHHYSRIIVMGVDDSDIRGYVIRSEVLKYYIENKNYKVKDILHIILHLSYETALPLIFNKLMKRHGHISALVDAEGQFIGIISLEDIIEHMIGLEIYDEFD